MHGTFVAMPKRDLVWDCTACGRQANFGRACAKCGRDEGNAQRYDLIDFERTTGGTRVLEPDDDDKPRFVPSGVVRTQAPAPVRKRRSRLRPLILLVLLAATVGVAPFAVRWGGTRGKGGPLLRVGPPKRGSWVLVVAKRVENGRHIARVRTPDYEIVDLEIDRARWQSLKKGEIRNATYSRFGGLVSLGDAQRERL